jgi:hypothetical protein
MLKIVYLDRTVSLEQMVKMFGNETAGASVVDLLPKSTETGGDAQKKKLNFVPETAFSSQETTSNVSLEHPLVSTVVPSGDAQERAVLDNDSLSAGGSIVDDNKFNELSPDAEASPDIIKLWPSFLELLLRDRPKLGSFLSLASVAACSPHVVDIRFSPSLKFQFQELNKKQNREEISRLLHTLTNKAVDIRMTLETEVSGDETLKYINQMAGRSVTINDEIEQEPIIQTVLDMFDGEIVG